MASLTRIDSIAVSIEITKKYEGILGIRQSPINATLQIRKKINVGLSIYTRWTVTDITKKS